MEILVIIILIFCIALVAFVGVYKYNEKPIPEKRSSEVHLASKQEVLTEDVLLTEDRILSEYQQSTQQPLAEDAIPLSENRIIPDSHLSTVSFERQAVTHVEKPSSDAGLKSHNFIQVSDAYFPPRQGGDVVFYHDSHSVPIPPFAESEGLFAAIENAILKAKDYIYIVAYSFWPEIRLRREENSLILGDILKQKAREGVEVKILLWREIFQIFNFAEVRQKDILNFFHDSEVEVVFAVRHRSNAGFLEHNKAPFMWAHHQKCVVVDQGKEGALAFLGGIDITKGRWDTPEHQLFETLGKEHKGDFMNGFINVSPECGPREPWHDIHMRVSGPIVLDILQNFRERWQRERRRIVDQDDLCSEISYDLDPKPTAIWNKLPIIMETKHETRWVTQLLRTIDDTSADFERQNFLEVDESEGCQIDQSIQQGVIEIIRNAQGFLYIENQYFTGSSKYWECEPKVEAKNPIPQEIVQKIIQKIRMGEQFCTYIVLPLLPQVDTEHHLSTKVAKGILYCQFQTMQMMYKMIAQELQAVGSDAQLTDYLVFLCLGKQESKPNYAEGGVKEPEPGSKELKWHNLSHFPIYVHSKLIIADDCYLLTGSANFNERSFAGNRDTEIAVLAHQLNAVGNVQEVVTNGHINEFRRRLWAEHTQGLSESDPSLKDPSSLSAIRRIKELSNDALRAYIKGTEEHGVRFLRYPVDITKDGIIQAHPDMPNILDFENIKIEDILHQTPIEEYM